MRLHVPIPLRWSDLDAYGHVNNAQMLRLLEEARIRVFWLSDEGLDGEHAVGSSTAVLDGSAGSATLSLIARQEIEYLAPVPYQREPVDVQLWIGRLGGASIEVCYEIFSPVGVEPSVLYARAATTLVLVATATGRPRKMTDHERAAWAPYVDAPVEFTKRR